MLYVVSQKRVLPCPVSHARGGKLIVCINHNEQTVLKKGRPFMRCAERLEIIRALRDVDTAFASMVTDRSAARPPRVGRGRRGTRR